MTETISVGSESGAENPEITNAQKSYGALTNVAGFLLHPNNVKSEIFGDIIQGAAINCYFHAALHSTAWVWYPFSFPLSLNEIQFSGQPYPIELRFPLDADGRPVCAQKSGAREYWGPAWEKGYGEFKNLPRSPLSPSPATTPPYDPDLLLFGPGDPLDSLSEITTWEYDFETAKFGYPTAYDLEANPTVSCYQKLLEKNNGGSNTVSTAISTITKYPTVAWTKDTCPAYSPALVASHAYSVLGTFTPNNGTTKIIVLRNPWGIPFQTGILNDLAQSGSYKPPTADIAISLGASSTRGIFGVKNAVFNNYFAGFGWVQPHIL